MLTLGATDNLAMKQDAGTDVAFAVGGDDVTLSTKADDYKLFGQGVGATTPTALFTSPASDHAFIIDFIKVTNPTAATVRTVTLYIDKGGTTYDATTQWVTLRLGPGEYAEWNGTGWTTYNANGLRKADGAGAFNYYLINVKDFGAKGDDSTDDTQAIKDARDYGVNNFATFGFTLFFPSGVYRVSSVIAFTSNKIELRGAGRGSSKIRNTDASLTADILTFGSQSEITLEDFSIWSNVNRTAGSGIHLNGTSSVVINNMFIWNMFIGINMTSPSQLVSITNVTIHGPTTAGCYGINLHSNDFGDFVIGPNVVISQVNAGSPGTGLQINSTMYLSAIGVDIIGWKNGMVINPPANEHVTWCFFNSVLFDTSGEIGAAINSGASTQYVRGIFFTNCWFATSGQTGGGSGLGDGVNMNIQSTGIVDDIRFFGCRMLNNKLHGIHVNHANVKNVTVTSCTIAANSQQTANTYSGVKLVAGVSNFNISENRIGGAYHVFNNQQKYGVELDTGTSNNYNIDNNDISGNDTANNTGAIFDGGTTSGFGQKSVSSNIGHKEYGRMDTIITATGGINTTETVLLGGTNKAPMPKNSLSPGDRFKFLLWGTCTASVGNVTTFRIRIGTAGTTADGVVMTVTLPTSAAAGTNIPFKIEGEMVIRTIGASATVHGTATVTNQSITSNSTASTGIMVFAEQIIVPTFATFSSLVANYMSVTFVSAGTTTTCTFQGGHLEWL